MPGHVPHTREKALIHCQLILGPVQTAAPAPAPNPAPQTDQDVSIVDLCCSVSISLSCEGQTRGPISFINSTDDTPRWSVRATLWREGHVAVLRQAG
ncbi:hypothetical protein AAFF_G00394190 [Aldrovandia affinis]|uniref:Uncharacterized protein n=1 Tax=Aldrovandia affinis TaxID=143900 RepID=A0AAD7WL29_9TELE|nr:hypothetical protein AAFF_G00394190 [Aldrovandia affinis]